MHVKQNSTEAASVLMYSRKFTLNHLIIWCKGFQRRRWFVSCMMFESAANVESVEGSRQGHRVGG